MKTAFLISTAIVGCATTVAAAQASEKPPFSSVCVNMPVEVTPLFETTQGSYSHEIPLCIDTTKFVQSGSNRFVPKNQFAELISKGFRMPVALNQKSNNASRPIADPTLLSSSDDGDSWFLRARVLGEWESVLSWLILRNMSHLNLATVGVVVSTGFELDFQVNKHPQGSPKGRISLGFNAIGFAKDGKKYNLHYEPGYVLESYKLTATFNK